MAAGGEPKAVPKVGETDKKVVEVGVGEIKGKAVDDKHWSGRRSGDGAESGDEFRVDGGWRRSGLPRANADKGSQVRDRVGIK